MAQRQKKPAGPDPYSDIAMGLLYVVIGGVCHLVSRTDFTKTMLILISLVAAYMIIRGIVILVKKGRKQ
ncbi:MAG: hypothetical protein HFI39_14260 [Lachnospiraceae bacterium]|nr:hypothetical protein [Lachnospiraceae bacterium]